MRLCNREYLNCASFPCVNIEVDLLESLGGNSGWPADLVQTQKLGTLIIVSNYLHCITGLSPSHDQLNSHQRLKYQPTLIPRITSYSKPID